ncbi:MAG: NepR family anti-sigma factor [Rhodobacteraceae bacterium]|nr:NepR family anti-sigma factor [Paracoccaceae bacterium]|tara:strand:+ start:13903 stop:14121 length:219 start_codon:yes stop_codon:yes gene_type:complete
MSGEPEGNSSDKSADKSDDSSTPKSGRRVKNKADEDRLDDNISAFYDDLANEPMPERLRDLLKNLNEKDDKK